MIRVSQPAPTIAPAVTGPATRSSPPPPPVGTERPECHEPPKLRRTASRLTWALPQWWSARRRLRRMRAARIRVVLATPRTVRR